MNIRWLTDKKGKTILQCYMNTNPGPNDSMAYYPPKWEWVAVPTIVDEERAIVNDRK